MLRGTMALIVAFPFGVGVTTVALAQFALTPEASKPSATAPTGEAKKPAQKVKTVAGKVRSVDAASLVVEVSGETPKAYTFALAGTTIKVGGKEGTSTDLKEGDTVRVTSTESEGKLIAKTVIAPAAKAKK